MSKKLLTPCTSKKTKGSIKGKGLLQNYSIHCLAYIQFMNLWCMTGHEYSMICKVLFQWSIQKHEESENYSKSHIPQKDKDINVLHVAECSWSSPREKSQSSVQFWTTKFTNYPHSTASLSNFAKMFNSDSEWKRPVQLTFHHFLLLEYNV